MDERTRKRLDDVARKRAELERQIEAMDAEERRLLEMALDHIIANPSAKVRRRLRDRAKRDTVDAVDTPASQTRSARVSRARIARGHRDHPFVAALVERSLTVTDAAKALGYGRTTVQSWYADGDAARPIPREAAQKALTQFGVPLSAWRRITD